MVTADGDARQCKAVQGSERRVPLARSRHAQSQAAAARARAHAAARAMRKETQQVRIFRLRGGPRCGPRCAAARREVARVLQWR
eukprot:7717115-Lingulodinium_polyedra.AAC.1